MTAARFREILGVICWTLPQLAEILAMRVEEVQRWHDGLELIPDNVGRWLQKLAKVHVTDQPAGRATPARIVFARRPTQR